MKFYFRRKLRDITINWDWGNYTTIKIVIQRYDFLNVPRVFRDRFFSLDVSISPAANALF